MRDDLQRFEKHWREENAKHPEMFPMEMPAENAGIWWEQFIFFRDEP